ncbi:MAG: hypothetical protein UV64_C0003G0005 [Parcubacteria group bacterium GW2011_GWC1_43_11b]|uniref:Uncharacterized protein n=2 Tax=Candidatus Vogeliibacteriota TaxID=1817922 RepID=A0A1G2QBW5_9BACT|nr:MAG: hypothetical protein UV50_C0003G0005 [Parcubacteria group bacterium GW2011_GWB1_42_9]KKS89607.1 MAG: hypothetical protein UV64_C0003G0005 [Parcubacteria group bacterium GW2011_GWC1_43_11b]KKT10058.1 MAG: hypothetical protein UV88_C0002G0005 [Parcubacteria group bacterium GW2011_GWA1_43_21]OHA58045.1 MAG: hypothetical protein A2370_01630 [Candidatus Vogelbacteria bacterium RIFOXYB1_FULL_42_16]OHA58314.1 MAG: hypothetical protein A2607_00305 [Candidatus Vogelbacteria bacterium RIFOXYD1_FU
MTETKVPSLKEVEDSILSFLDGIEVSSERTEAIDDLLHRLNFERRVTILTDEERERMMKEGLSPTERESLNCVSSDPKAFEERLQSYARSIYFRRCAWENYLNGLTDQKPFSSKV